MTDLLDAFEAQSNNLGGEFGRRVLQAIEERVIKELNGRAELSENVHILACSALVAGQKVYVDSRLEVSCLST